MYFYFGIAVPLGVFSYQIIFTLNDACCYGTLRYRCQFVIFQFLHVSEKIIYPDVHSLASYSGSIQGSLSPGPSLGVKYLFGKYLLPPGAESVTLVENCRPN